MKQDRQLGVGKIGMNKDAHITSLDERAYIHALNANYEGQSGDSVNLQNEESNILCSRFVEGFKVVGIQTDITADRTYFFLTNPDTGHSEIGYIQDLEEQTSFQDTLSNCNCDIKTVLSDGLEKLEQVETCEFISIIKDYECTNGETPNHCLNFNINYPISITLKDEKCGKVLYFTDDLNPRRRLELDNLSQYYTISSFCEEEDTSQTVSPTAGDGCDCGVKEEDICLNCNKMLVMPVHTPMCLDIQGLVDGGQVRHGQYMFFSGYCDSLGNMITDYVARTTATSVKDLNKNIYQQPELDAVTNTSIKLQVNDLDPAFQYYKVAVVQKSAIDGAQSYFSVGVFPTSTNTVIFSGTNNLDRITIDELTQVLPDYLTAKTNTQVNNSLFYTDLTARPDPNLQPVVNLMGQFAKWRTSFANEDLYQRAVGVANYRSYMRDELYTFGLRFTTDQGYQTPVYPLISRQATDEDRLFTGETDIEEQALTIDGLASDLILPSPNWQDDVYSVLKTGSGLCGGSERNEKWQFYNTAEQTNTEPLYLECSDYDIETENKPVSRRCVQTDSDVFLYAGESFVLDNFTEEDTFTDLFTYIQDNPDSLPTSPINLQDRYDSFIGGLSCDDCDVDSLFFDGCGNPDLGDPIKNLLSITSTNNVPVEFQITYQPCSFYSRLATNTDCDSVYIFTFDDSGNARGSNLNTADSAPYPYTAWLGFDADTNPAYYSRTTNFLNNDNPANPFGITPLPYDDVTLSFNITPLFPSQNNETNKSSLLTTIATNSLFISYGDLQGVTSSCASKFVYRDNEIVPSFENFVHKNALWYEVSNVEDQIIVNISQIQNPNSAFRDCLRYSNYLRLSVFDTNNTLLKDGNGNDYVFLVDVRGTSNENGVYCLDIPDTIDTVKLAIDAPLIAVRDSSNPITPPLLPSPSDFDPNYNYVYATGTENCLNLGVHRASIDTVTVSAPADTDFSMFGEVICTYTASCPVPVDESLRCNPLPEDEGKFGYWESTVNYPNNEFLYNSSSLDISSWTAPSSIESEFTNTFVTGGQLNANADFSCKPIRHFKFPDFNTSPTIDQFTTVGQDNKIKPIGFYLDNEVISSFLDLAVLNDLITQEFRDSITKYEVLRGDSRLNRSIVAKGLTYDMYSYNENQNEKNYFSNFPYNDLSSNKLIFLDKNRNSFIEHPDPQDKENNRYSFFSPETLYDKPALPFELYVETFMKGNSRGSFSEVQSHPTMTILTDTAYDLAKLLATAEVILEFLSNTSEFISRITVGFSTNVGAIVATGIYALAQTLASFSKARRKIQEWVDIFYNLSKPSNFAHYYASVGKYNSYENFSSETEREGQLTRGLSERQYLGSGRYRFNEAGEATSTVINNVDRESSVYLYTKVPLKPPTSIKDFDYSRFKSSDYGCDPNSPSGEYLGTIASPYVSLKQYVPDQYGEINDIFWITTGYCGNLNEDNTCDVVYGGDTFLSRFWFKRKYPFFINSMIDGKNSLPDLTPFDYTLQRNAGYPTFYVDYLTDEDDPGQFIGIPMRAPFLRSDYNFDCLDVRNRRGNPSMYVQGGSKFYLYYYGIPGYIVESRVNNNYRYGENNTDRDFYPNQSDYMRWTQENNVSIRTDNFYAYNNIYSSNNDITSFRTLPDNYEPEEWNCRFNHSDRVIYSLQDNNEQDLVDNFRVFKANNYWDFGNKYGKLYDFRNIESDKVIARFENGVVVLNAFNTLEGSSENLATGTGNIFTNRPTEFFKTELGYGGTQHRAFVSCEFGHFYVDAKRGRIFQIAPNGGGIEEISRYNMKNWFRENLPFRIKKQFPDIPSDMLDNAYDGLGITMVWDDRYSRLLITKKDAILKPEFVDETEIVDLDFYYREKLIHPSDTDYFDEVSWTVGYSPITKSWISFYSYTPNYYVGHQNYFSSGLNYGNTGIWNHQLGSNQTFQVFYGELKPWTVELPIKSNLQTKMYEDFSYRLDVRRYANEYDYGYYESNFNTAVFYNDRESTGFLKLIKQNNQDQRQLIEYPKYTPDGVEVLAVNEDYTWSTNYFYDNVKENHSLPLWVNSLNNVDKEINPLAYDFRPTFKNHIRGQYLRARLTQDAESRLKYIFEHFISDSKMYDGY